MEYIRRPNYLEEISKYIDKPVIKVLTGMRRVGKSTMLEMVRSELLTGVPQANIIHLRFDSFSMLNIRSAESLKDYLVPLIDGLTGKIYFFFDEVQLVDGWEQIVNGLQVDYNCDIYITGSNSTMLSGDLATMLAGRYVNFEIQPFSFSEFIEAHKNSELNLTELFNKYILIGGIPLLNFFALDEETSHKYLSDVYNTVLVKDVLEYNKIRDVDIFNRILTYAVENVGHTFSALSIRNYLKSEGRNISVDTVLNYLEYCQNAFLIKKIPRYDVVGKKLLKIEEKYYLTDHGFRQSKGFSNMKDIERILENIVFEELLSRGYQVKIGKIGDREIDFIAEKNGKIEYYQVSYLMANEATRAREFEIYRLIEDNFPKHVLSMDVPDFSRDGIIHKNIIDWLLRK